MTFSRYTSPPVRDGLEEAAADDLAAVGHARLAQQRAPRRPRRGAGRTGRPAPAGWRPGPRPAAPRGRRPRRPPSARPRSRSRPRPRRAAGASGWSSRRRRRAPASGCCARYSQGSTPCRWRKAGSPVVHAVAQVLPRAPHRGVRPCRPPIPCTERGWSARRNWPRSVRAKAPAPSSASTPTEATARSRRYSARGWVPVARARSSAVRGPARQEVGDAQRRRDVQRLGHPERHGPSAPGPPGTRRVHHRLPPVARRIPRTGSVGRSGRAGRRQGARRAVHRQ